jgi:hypothetical protein
VSAKDDAAIQYAIGLIEQIPRGTPDELEAHLTSVLIVFWSALWGSFGTEYAEGFIKSQLDGMRQQSETYVRNVQ